MIITLLQWNVWYLEKLDRIAEQIQKLSPDILCLQELSTKTEVNPGVSTGHALARYFEMHSFVKTAQTWVGWHKDSQENGILSRFPMRKTSSTFIRAPGPEESRDFTTEGRVYLQAEIDIEGRFITVGTTHLSYSHRFESSEPKRQEYAKLLSLLAPRERFIFAGDLNSPPESEIVRELSDRYLHAGPPVSGNTWTTKPFDCNGFVETGLSWRLDYVFASPDMRVVTSRLVDTEVSDHLPILIEIEV